MATAAQPKVLTMLAGRTLLEWKQVALNAAGIAQICALTGYRGDTIANTGVHCIHNPRWASTNMVGTLLCADAVLSRPGRTLVCYGDVVFHPGIVETALDTAGDIVLPYDRRWRTLWEARFDDPLGDAESFIERGGQLVEIGRRARHLDEIEGQFMGLLLITESGWAAIRGELSRLASADIDLLETTSLLRQLIQAGTAIRTVPCDGRWCEVDSQSDIQRYTELLAKGGWAHDWRWGT